MTSVTFHDPTSAKERRLPRRCAPRNDNRFHINRQSPLTQITLTGCRFWNTPNISRLLYLSLVLAVISTCCGIEEAKAPKPIHDVAITDISAPPSCTQGDTVPIKITVANQGTRRETFRVMLTENISGKEISSKEVTLAKGWNQGAASLISGGFALFKDDTDERSNLGFSLCATGDVNNDGFADMLIGDGYINNFRGKVSFYYGGKTIDTVHPDYVFSGENDGDQLGAQTVDFGDVNGDGYDDIIIGATLYGSEDMDGRAYVFLGGPGIDAKADLILEGEDGKNSRFGIAVAAGDIDNDGYDDVLVGAQSYNDRMGRVYLFWGGQPMDAIPDVVFDGEYFPEPNPYATFQKYGDKGGPLVLGSWFGRRIDASGDINGDGHNDIVVGARHAGIKDNGSAYLFLGKPKKEMDAICDFCFRGEDSRDEMGAGCKLFDIDNDGFDDLLICARYARDWRGAVYIWWGGERFDGNRPADLVLVGEPLSNMGGDAIACGYFNDDEYGDILVGGYNYPRYPIKNGRAYIFYGNERASMDTTIDHIFDPEGDNHHYFGSRVSAGDVNKDGFMDALIGAEGNGMSQGKAYLYYGPFQSSTDITFNWNTTNVSPDKHTLKASIAPITGEEDVADNMMTVTIEVKEKQ
ncbi:MAG: FG-GAP repeat protein [Phycisphaerae bacterium]|nr:FG-GAP repeat protein [Phycisphaerae bacterium]